MDEAPKSRPARRKKPAASVPADKGLRPALMPEGEIDPERRAKIEKIKQALADGTYRIANEDVARKVIDHMREHES